MTKSDNIYRYHTASDDDYKQYQEGLGSGKSVISDQKSVERVDEITQQAFENGSKEMLNDCKAGRYAKTEEIYNATQVKMLINDAIRKHNETTAIMLKHLKGRYDLPADVDQMIQDLELAGKEADRG